MNIDKIAGYKGNLLHQDIAFGINVPLVNMCDKWHILFEVRSKYITQAGEVCLPGGRVEDGESPRQAAIRETVEELGVSESQIKYISELDYKLSSSGSLIRPYLTELKINDLNCLNINSLEVSEVFTVPLEFFVQNQADTYLISTPATPCENFPFDKIPNGKNYNWGHRGYECNFYYYQDYVIWGLTAGIIKNTIERLMGLGALDV